MYLDLLELVHIHVVKSVLDPLELVHIHVALSVFGFIRIGPYTCS